MYQVLLINNETKQQKIVDVDIDQWSEGSYFLWTEGNYSCDCNRHLFFTDWDGTDCECGEDKYTAICAVLDNGNIVFLDEINDPIDDKDFRYKLYNQVHYSVDGAQYTKPLHKGK